MFTSKLSKKSMEHQYASEKLTLLALSTVVTIVFVEEQKQRHSKKCPELIINEEVSYLPR